MEFIPKAKFLSEYLAWKNETQFSSIGHGFDNEHYRNIVAMGRGVVSYIHDIIKKEPDPIAYALEEILKDDNIKVKPAKYMTLDAYCKMWDMLIDSLWKVIPKGIKNEEETV
jgi:hypothetical protein